MIILSRTTGTLRCARSKAFLKLILTPTSNRQSMMFQNRLLSQKRSNKLCKVFFNTTLALHRSNTLTTSVQRLRISSSSLLSLPCQARLVTRWWTWWRAAQKSTNSKSSSLSMLLCQKMSFKDSTTRTAAHRLQQPTLSSSLPNLQQLKQQRPLVLFPTTTHKRLTTAIAPQPRACPSLKRC